MRRSRTRKPSAKPGSGSVVKADPAGSGPAAQANPAGSSRAAQAGGFCFSLANSALAGPASSSRVGPVGVNLGAKCISAQAFKDKGLMIPPSIGVVPSIPTKGKRSAVRIVRNPQTATALDKLPSKESQIGGAADSRDVLKEKATTTTTTSPKDHHLALDKSQSKTSRPRHVSKRKATTVTTTAPILKGHHIKSMPSFSQRQQEPPIAGHIICKDLVSDVVKDPPLEPLGERCQLCGIDLAFRLTASTSYSDEPPVHAVLPCSHCFHYSCLEGIFGSPEPSQIPPCVICLESGTQN